MKKTTLYISAVATAVILTSSIFIGCKKKSTTSNNTTITPATYTNSFSYKVNGLAASVTSLSAQQTAAVYNMIWVSAFGATENFQLKIDSAIVVGPNPTSTLFNSLQYSPAGSLTGFVSKVNSGSINVSKYDKTAKIIEGTFGATCYDLNNSANSVVISDGIFKIKY
jgi:hypothetical protein